MRQYCKHCRYPLSQCLCDAVSPVHLSADVVILQHPKERRHAKNTARLAALCAERLQVVSSNDCVAMRCLESKMDGCATALIYPSPHSAPIEQHTATARTIDLWLFLDGSWKQTYALLQQYPFLQQCPAFHFSAAPPSTYDIRHTRLANSVSTLEAVAYTMKTVYADDTTPMITLQTRLTEHWQGPVAHRR